MAWYPKAKRLELPKSKTAPFIAPRSIVLHTGVTNQGSLYPFFNGRSQGVESHFYVGRDGAVVEQYVDTARRADCQLDGNDYAISIETWDGAGEEWDGKRVADIPPWSPQQMDALVELVAWLCRSYHIPAVKCPSWDGRGIGYHSQFTGGPKRWNEHHACPGPARIRQVPTLIAKTKAALAGPAPKPATEDELDATQAKQLSGLAKDAEKNQERYDDIQAKPSKVRDDTVAIKQTMAALKDQLAALAVLVKGPQA
jgi:hypothetical protein